MTINIVTLLALLIFAICIVDGAVRGFAQSSFHLISWILITVLVSALNPYVSGFIQENTGLQENLTTRLEKTIEEKVEEKLEEADEDEDKEEKENTIGTDISSTLKMMGVELPKSVVETLDRSPAETAEEVLEESGVYRTAAESVAGFIVKGVVFFVTLLLAAFVLKQIELALKILTKLPVLHFIDRALGALAGAAKGLLFVWLFFYLITLVCTTSFGVAAVKQIYENPYLVWIYENNVILSLILWILGR